MRERYLLVVGHYLNVAAIFWLTSQAQQLGPRKTAIGIERHAGLAVVIAGPHAF